MKRYGQESSVVAEQSLSGETANCCPRISDFRQRSIIYLSSTSVDRNHQENRDVVVSSVSKAPWMKPSSCHRQCACELDRMTSWMPKATERFIVQDAKGWQDDKPWQDDALTGSKQLTRDLLRNQSRTSSNYIVIESYKKKKGKGRETFYMFLERNLRHTPKPPSLAIIFTPKSEFIAKWTFTSWSGLWLNLVLEPLSWTVRRDNSLRCRHLVTFRRV